METTHNKANGSPLPLAFMESVGALCQAKGLIFHVDGARLMNASVALRTPAADLCRRADSISICLSKGLGAPVGSLTVGSKGEGASFQPAGVLGCLEWQADSGG